MSEQAKKARLQEGIKQAQNDERLFGVLLFVALAVAVFGFLLTSNAYASTRTFGWIMGISGVTFLPILWVGIMRSYGRKKALMRELDSMGVKVPSASHGIAYEEKPKENVEEEIPREAYGEKTPIRRHTALPKEMTEDPVEILKLRLAKGKISKEEYEELRKRIED